MIAKCKCKHEQQDTMHGKGNRVFNPLKRVKETGKHRCTVCGTVKIINKSKK